MLTRQFIHESAAKELAQKLPSLKKHDYDTIDKLMRSIAKKHNITGKALHDLFVEKYKKTPDSWIKNKLDEKNLTTESISKTTLRRMGKQNDIPKIRKVYENLCISYYGKNTLNSVTEWVNNLVPQINEGMDPEIKSFYEQLKHYSKNSHVPIKIGASLCLMQAILDIYSHTVILRGFKNPKKIVNIEYDQNQIKQLEFDDGTVFPEKYEYSTTDLGYDLLNTFFFNDRKDLEKMVSIISMIKPDSYDLGHRGLHENKSTKTSNIKQEVDKFVAWAKKELNLKTAPIIELSTDTRDARQNHHTGRHTEGDNRVWVYVKNRNLVDILRTVCHELVHVRQSELDMIDPGDSYPGSPIEMIADMQAGKMLKIYGKMHRHIFQ